MTTILIITLIVCDDEMNYDYDPAVQIFIGVCLSSMQWLYSSSSRFAVYRVFSCTHQKLERHMVLLGRTTRYLLMIVLSTSFMNLQVKCISDPNNIWTILLTYRAFSRLFHCPFSAAFEALILLAFPNEPVALLAASFSWCKFMILLRKITFIFSTISA